MLWEGHSDCAYFGTLYNAGDRRVVACNTRAAELLGAHKEELLARYAWREVEVPYVHSDWLANFVHDLDFADEDRNDRFMRWAVRRAGVRRGVLVQSSKAKFFDSAGRVSRVKNLVMCYCVHATVAWSPVCDCVELWQAATSNTSGAYGGEAWHK